MDIMLIYLPNCTFYNLIHQKYKVFPIPQLMHLVYSYFSKEAVSEKTENLVSQTKVYTTSCAAALTWTTLKDWTNLRTKNLGQIYNVSMSSWEQASSHHACTGMHKHTMMYTPDSPGISHWRLQKLISKLYTYCMNTWKAWRMPFHQGLEDPKF